MQIILDYLSYSYMTLMLICGLSVIMIANRKAKIKEVKYLWSIIGVVLALTICEYIGEYCYDNNEYRNLHYIKTMLVYWLLPMTALLEIYLIIPTKHKFLIAIPQIINMIITFIDLFETRLVYYFSESGAFKIGILRPLPFTTVLFYVIWLTVYSIRFISCGDKSKGFIVVCISLLTLLGIISEYTNFASGYSESVAVLDIMLYYFYLSAIHHSEVQNKLHAKEMELEKNKLTVLMAQIKPHFINNSMNSIIELCYIDPEKAADTIIHFSNFLQGKFEVIDRDVMMPFYKEIELIKEYLSIEYADSNKKFKVEFDLHNTDFLIPALTLQPLVENAVKHGIDRYSEKSLIRIVSYKDENDICISVTDNRTAEKGNRDKRFTEKRSIGLKNVSDRLSIMCGGELIFQQTADETEAKIRIHEIYGENNYAHNYS